MKKIVSIILAVVLFAVAIPTIPALLKTDVAEAASSSKWVSDDITMTTDQNVYNLLTDPDAGIVMNKGDEYVFNMDLYWNNDGGPNFSFDLLQQSDATSYPAGIDFINGGKAMYWSETWSNAWVNDAKTGQLVWPLASYDITFTVKAYESIGVKLICTSNNNELLLDSTVKWSNIYGLKSCAEGATFKPCIIRKAGTGTISNISVTKIGKMTDASDWNTSATMTTSNQIYNLLADSDACLVMEKGDEYVFNMDLYWNNDGGPNFSFDLLQQSDATSYPAGIDFINGGKAMYWSETWSNAWVNDGKTGQLVWPLASYDITFTVKAYESIGVKLICTSNNNELLLDSTVKWSNIYGLKSCAEGATFKPCIIRKAGTGTISNISVTKVGKMTDASDWNTSLTLTDTDTTATGTKAVYDLLAGTGTRLTMSKGDVFVFDMDIKQNVHNSGNGQLTQNMFAFDLLKKSDATTQPTGIEFQNGQVLYWISNGAWGAHVNDKQTSNIIWAGGVYHYRFTVNAYESIRVEVINDQGNTQYDGTVAWSLVYGLSSCTEDSNTMFRPNLIFTDQVGTVSNIEVTYIDTSDIDTSMLDVKAQSRVNPATDTNTDIRFISSVNNGEDYSEAGFVFSLKSATPVIGGNNCATRSTTTVYEKIYADGELIDVADAGYDDTYSTYMFVKGLSNFTTDMTIYVRAYVKLADSGAIVYGDVVEISVTGTNSITRTVISN